MIAISLQDATSLRDILAINRLVEVLVQSLDMDMDPMAMMPTARQELIMASGGEI